MKAIENILNDVQTRIAQINEELEALTKIEQIYMQQLNLKSGASKLSDYPLQDTLQGKMAFFDAKSAHGWRMTSRAEQIRTIENDQSEKTLKYISQDLGALVDKKIYIRGKFNNTNKYSFYFRPEWLEKIGENQYRIKPEFAPEEKDMRDIPIEKRNPDKITWDNVVITKSK